MVVASSVTWLGFDVDCVDFGVPEVLAAAVRRGASCLCPCSARQLTNRVEESLRGLTPLSSEELRSEIRSMVDNLVSYGDLLEAPILDDGTGISYRTLFLSAHPLCRLDPAWSTCLEFVLTDSLFSTSR